MEKSTKIYLAGHRGLAGAALLRALEAKGYRNFVVRTHAELDLTRQADVEALFAAEKPEVVILAAAKVGGIKANDTFRAQFLYENLAIQNNVIHAAHLHKAARLLFLGSNCIYPKLAPQPLREESLLTSELEPTNEPYAIAKIAGLKLCESYNRQYGSDFIAVMPTNLYGPDDNFDLFASHMVPATLRKFHLAKLLAAGDRDGVQKDLRAADWAQAEAILAQFSIRADSVTIWGTGTPRREFIHVDDMADACVFLLERPGSEIFHQDPLHQFINIGSGVDHSILEIAEVIRGVVGFPGRILTDPSKPDGTPRKLQSVEKLTKLGWTYRIPLEEGVKRIYQDYLAGRGRR
ncbi:MAG: GDP-L-fucose synthase [Spirochaetes bacterium]|nr:GDP-L-fucose synthase [Spirochaetota bacterium]